MFYQSYNVFLNVFPFLKLRSSVHRDHSHHTPTLINNKWYTCKISHSRTNSIQLTNNNNNSMECTSSSNSNNSVFEISMGSTSTPSSHQSSTPTKQPILSKQSFFPLFLFLNSLLVNWNFSIIKQHFNAF